MAELPLTWPLLPPEENLPPSPKVRYRSTYRYLGPEPLLDPTTRATLSDFEFALDLVDFSPLERVLAQVYVPSQKGQVPFHPVSLFLSLVLRLEHRLSWVALATLLASPEHGAGWRRLFGFANSPTPSASGLRYFHHALGSTLFDSLNARFIALLQAHNLFSEKSTYPNDPPDRGISVTQDGMLHQARSHPSCPLTDEACYQDRQVTEPPTDPGESETAPETAPETAQRPCRAMRAGQEGCRCDTPACQEQCRRASRLDPDARLIHYAGHNKRGPKVAPSIAKQAGSGTGRSQGINVFGYRTAIEASVIARSMTASRLPGTSRPVSTRLTPTSGRSSRLDSRVSRPSTLTSKSESGSMMREWAIVSASRRSGTSGRSDWSTSEGTQATRTPRSVGGVGTMAADARSVPTATPCARTATTRSAVGPSTSASRSVGANPWSRGR